MKDTIHGHVVVAQFTTPARPATRAGRLVLVARERDWVSSWQGDGDGEWTQGHYFERWDEARDHFLAACAREERP